MNYIREFYKKITRYYVYIEYISHISSAAILDEAIYNYRCGNLKDVYFKYPKDYFDIVLNIVNKWIGIKDSWGGNEKKWNAFLGDYIVNGLNASIINTYNPKNKLSRQKRDKYIVNLIQKDIVQLVFENYNSKKFGNKLLGYCIRNGNYLILKSWIRLKMLK